MRDLWSMFPEYKGIYFENERCMSDICFLQKVLQKSSKDKNNNGRK